MYTHRIILLIFIACWLFLPALFDWWLQQKMVLLLTFCAWLLAILLTFFADLRQPRL